MCRGIGSLVVHPRVHTREFVRHNIDTDESDETKMPSSSSSCRSHLHVLRRRIQFESVEWLEKQLKNGMLHQLASLVLQSTQVGLFWVCTGSMCVYLPCPVSQAPPVTDRMVDLSVGTHLVHQT